MAGEGGMGLCAEGAGDGGGKEVFAEGLVGHGLHDGGAEVVEFLLLFEGDVAGLGYGCWCWRAWVSLWLGRFFW